MSSVYTPQVGGYIARIGGGIKYLLPFPWRLDWYMLIFTKHLCESHSLRFCSLLAAKEYCEMTVLWLH